MSINIDASDEATGLPPLEEVDHSAASMVVTWMLGAESIGSVNDEPVPFKILSLRVLEPVEEEDGAADWTQLHLAFPDELVRPMLETWLSLLDKEPDLGNDTP